MRCVHLLHTRNRVAVAEKNKTVLNKRSHDESYVILLSSKTSMADQIGESCEANHTAKFLVCKGQPRDSVKRNLRLAFNKLPT